MGEQIISFETAKIAKVKGFIGYGNMYNSDGKLIPYFPPKGNPLEGYENRSTYFASTQSLLQKWLREEHEVIVWLIPAVDDFTCFVSDGYPALEESKIIYRSNESGVWEDILEEGLFNALKSLP